MLEDIPEIAEKTFLLAKGFKRTNASDVLYFQEGDKRIFYRRIEQTELYQQTKVSEALVNF